MKDKSVMLLSIIFLFFCASCKIENPQIKNRVFAEVSPKTSALIFQNKIVETEENNHLVWESIYNGAGLGVGDINNDGLQDVYFCGNMTSDKLFLNKGNLVFENITEKSGINEKDWSSGVTMADVNNDGFLDIYVCKMSWFKDNEKPELRRNKLYVNNKDGTFSEKANDFGIGDIGHSTQASFFDYNKDGNLDLYVMNAPSHRYDQKINYIRTNNIPYEFADHLYLNTGQNKFKDVTNDAIGSLDYGFGLGLNTTDINQDGWIDIYVANDFEKPDILLINDKNGKFKDESKEKLRHLSFSSMGMDVADLNNDTLFDIAVLDMQSSDHVRSKTNMPSMNIPKFWENVSRGYHFQYMSNMIQLNNGMGYYSEVGQLTGMASTDWSWSILMADFDNDGFKDAMITNGINRNIKDNDFNVMMQKHRRKEDFSFLDMAMKTKVEKVKNFAFKNIAGTLLFDDVSDEWGFNHNGFSYGMTYADFDNDGDLDVIVSNNNENVKLYENQNLEANNFLRIKPLKNKSTALNTKVKIFYGDKMQLHELHNVRGYQSCVEPIIHCGLLNETKVDSVHVVFLNGRIKKLYNVKTNQTIEVNENDANDVLQKVISNPKLVKDVTEQSGLRFVHKENPYDDFTNQILLPHMQSHCGPFATVGDVNNDGLEDIFIGGAKGQAGGLYLQKTNGNFSLGNNTSFNSDSYYEDMGCVFFDVDNDKDLDLYVSSGGYEDVDGASNIMHRLYINDGKGNFKKEINIELPSTNASVAIPIDVNNDGYKDLFVGGKVEGKKYPYPGTSHLLMNNRGKLARDVTFKYEKLGMVTYADTLDVNKDGWQDLVVVGEWMTPTILINENGNFNDRTMDFMPEHLNGWWFSVKAEDLDNDGIDEILLGNIGMNNKFNVSQKKPLKVYAADFDKNSRYDIILSKQSKYGEVPVRGFECSSQQLPQLKKKFDSYNDFALAKIPDIIDVEKSNPLQLYADNFSSGYLKMKNGKYEYFQFPTLAQISCVQGIEVLDINKDGMKDVIIVGNLFEAEVETTRHDASVGLIMLGGESGFKAMSPLVSGFYAAGNARKIEKIKIGKNIGLLVVNNNYRAQLFKVN